MASRSLTVRVIGWEKYNPRKDYKNPRWFAMSNRILENPDLFDLDASGLRVFIYILCQASQKSSDTIRINFDHANRVCGIKAQEIDKAMEALVGAGCVATISVDNTDPSIPRTESVRESTGHGRYITEQNNTEQNNTCSPEVSPNVFKIQDQDLLEIYSRYPRKEGKSKGFEKLRKEIRSAKDLEEFRSSVERYRVHCEKQGTETKYIKHFATFVSSWRDWLDPQTGSSFKSRPAPRIIAPPQDREPEVPAENRAEMAASLRELLSKAKVIA